MGSGTFGLILKSIDNGKNWKTLNHEKLSANFNVLGGDRLDYIQFVNNQTGWICGNGGVYKSTDTGLNWSKMKSTLFNTSHTGYFFNENEGYVSGAGASPLNEGIYIASFHTVDKGENWSLIRSDRPQISGDALVWAIDFIDARRGWAISGGGAVYKYEK